MDEVGSVALQYTSTEGLPSLREKIVARMKAKNGIDTDIDHVLITSGSQQGLDFSARIFLNPGDVVLLESPSYLGAVNAFKACEPRFIEVPTDDDGMITEELEKILATTENVKMIYVIPDFQNPTGKTWSLERRHKFMDIINRYEIPVIEDNPYGELRFEGTNMPSRNPWIQKIWLYSWAHAPRSWLLVCVSAGICASKENLVKYNFIKQGADLQSSTIDQLIADRFLDMYDLDEHRLKKSKTYIVRDVTLC